MVVSSEIKRSVVADWQRAFPDLRKVGGRRLLRIVGPLLTGLEVVTGPRDSYRLYNVAYPLWRTSLKDCLDYPEILHELEDEGGRQMFIEYKKHSESFPLVRQLVERGVLFQFSGNVSLSSLIKSIEKYGQTHMIRAQGTHARARLLRLMCLCSVFADRIDLARNFLDIIESEKGQWDMKRFVAMLGSFDTWFSDLFALVEARDKLHALVDMNLKDPKLIRFSKANLTPD